MSENNLRHWDALGKTDPKHTKPFQRAGGFRGTATKPIWTEYRLTEHFGPCGIGWGCDAPEFSLVPANDEILVFCTVAAWYIEDGKRATVYGVGGDKVLVKQSSGLRTDDEAYKKAFTDALGNAFKHVGSGADVHMGLFEDNKYVSEVRKEFSEDAHKTQAEVEPVRPAGRPQTPASARNAAPPPQPRAAAQGDPGAFWARDDYGLDPDVIGGLAEWDREFIRLADTAPNIDAMLKLKADNKAFHAAWYKTAVSTVREAFATRMSAAEHRLAAAERGRAA